MIQLPSVILGLAPPDKGQAPWQPTARSTIRLATILSVDPKNLQKYFAFDNLTDDPTLELQDQRKAGQAYRFLPAYRYILAGIQVVRALGTPRVGWANQRWHATCPPPCEWYQSREKVWCAVLPHPSGRNRWYNLADNMATARAFLQDARGSGLRSIHEAFWKAREKR